MNQHLSPIQKAAIKNYEKMVAKYQILKQGTFLKDVCWQDNKWHLSESVNLNFSYQLESTKRRKALPEDIAGSAKCLVIHLIDNSEWQLSSSYLAKSILAFNNLFTVLKIKHPAELTSDLYKTLVAYIKDKHTGTGINRKIEHLNRAVKFLNDECVVPASVETVNPGKFSKTDEFGIKDVVPEKMPSRLTVKAIIDLKHKIFKEPDGSGRYIIDRLCINTQAFLFGMGLRISEVLRLPYNCIVKDRDDLFLKVLTAKGQEPILRYIPEIWRPIITDAVDDIKRITKPYRKIAKQLEKRKIITCVSQRFDKRERSINSRIESFKTRTSKLIEKKVNELKKKFRLKPQHKKMDILTKEVLSEIEYLPIKFPKKASEFIKQCKRYGIKVNRKQTSRTYCTHHSVKHTEIERWLNDRVLERSRFLTEKEFFILLTGNSGSWKSHKDIKSKTVRLKALSRKIFYPNKHGRTGIRVIPIEAAIKIGEKILSGGYDYKNWIGEQELFQLIPEISTYRILGKKPKELKYKTSSAYVITDNVKYNKSFRTYKKLKLIRISSVHKYLYSRFTTLVRKFENQINQIENSYEEDQKDISIEIKSKSFRIKQKVSEHLFLHPEGQSFDGIVPKILGYFTVYYFLKGNDTEGRYVRSAFNRYGIGVSDEIIKDIVTHLGRHWQTTSLFRAGAPDYVVDLYMGREPGQGRNYDHNTAVERTAKMKALLRDDTENFIGNLADKIKNLRNNGMSDEQIDELLDQLITSAHYSPYGACIRNIALKPCRFNVRCIRGEKGEGCREFLVNRDDDEAIANIETLVEKSKRMLARLFKHKEKGNIHADKHINHHMQIVKNGEKILERVNSQLAEIIEFKPFINGSSPDLCPFQSGEVINY